MMRATLTCAGKIHYATKAEAQAVLRQTKSQADHPCTVKQCLCTGYVLAGYRRGYSRR